MATKRRIGILTSGGDCPGLNPVIRAVVKRGVTQLGWEVLGIRDSYNGLLATPFRVMNLDRDSVRGILTKGGTILGTTNHGDPFAFPMKGADGTKYVDRSAEVVEAIRILELDGLIVVGGDGSLAIAYRFMERGVKIVGVPKTIDNDIEMTDYTFGFHTAVEVATEAIDRLHSTAESHDRVMVVEVMGRDAGWIALHAGIAGGADVILIPEIPYEISRVCDKLRRRQAAGRFFSIVVVAEGAVEGGTDQQHLLEAGQTGRMPRLGGAGAHVAKSISDRTGIETRVTVLGHLQRGGTPSGYDRLLATRFGFGAVELVEQEQWGKMVALHGTELGVIDIKDIVGRCKHVDPKGQLVQTGKGLAIEFGG